MAAWRRALWGSTLAVLALGIVYSIGPRNPEIEWEATPAVPTLPELPLLEASLAAGEAHFADIVPQAEKKIVWGAAGHKQAPWAVVYLHGFSASRREMAPLPERLAERLGGHTYYTRLAGHGRGGAAMREASIAQWKQDALEALQVGQRLGERVVVVGNSTGATLAAWLAQREEAKDVAAFVMVSPNFGPKDPRAQFINWPWGRSLTRWVQGAMVQGAPLRDPREAQVWNKQYPVEALFPMMALVERVRMSDLSSIQAPTLMMASPRDSVIDVSEARAAFERIGSSHKQFIDVDYSESQGQHVLAGEIEAPLSVDPMVAQMFDFIQQQVPNPR